MISFRLNTRPCDSTTELPSTAWCNRHPSWLCGPNQKILTEPEYPHNKTIVFSCYIGWIRRIHNFSSPRHKPCDSTIHHGCPPPILWTKQENTLTIILRHKVLNSLPKVFRLKPPCKPSWIPCKAWVTPVLWLNMWNLLHAPQDMSGPVLWTNRSNLLFSVGVRHLLNLDCSRLPA